MKTDFERNGFVIIRGFVSDATLSEIRERLSGVLHIGQQQRGEAIETTSRSRFALTNVQKGLERVDPYFREFLERGPHMPLLEHLLGEPPTPATASYFSKDDPDEVVHPHRDGDNGATIWIALDPCGPNNGCLYFLKGSHLDRDLENKFELGDAADIADHPDACPAILQPGDMSIHYSTTVHWSGENQSSEPRRALNAFYQRRDHSR